MNHDDDMCPDTNEHPAEDCRRYGCENYLDELRDLAPWGTSNRGLRDWAR